MGAAIGPRAPRRRAARDGSPPRRQFRGNGTTAPAAASAVLKRMCLVLRRALGTERSANLPLERPYDGVGRGSPRSPEVPAPDCIPAASPVGDRRTVMPAMIASAAGASRGRRRHPFRTTQPSVGQLVRRLAGAVGTVDCLSMGDRNRGIPPPRRTIRLRLAYIYTRGAALTTLTNLSDAWRGRLPDTEASGGRWAPRQARKTPEESRMTLLHSDAADTCRRELAAILAKGLMRMRGRDVISAPPQQDVETADSTSRGLELSDDSWLSVQRG